MSSMQGLMAQWYFHVPNAILAALMCLLVCRYALELATGGRTDAPLVGALQGLTNFVVRPVRAMTPALVPHGLVVVLALTWLLALRMVWFFACIALGMRPTLGG